MSSFSHIPKHRFPGKVNIGRNGRVSLFRWRDLFDQKNYFLKGYSLDFLDSNEKYKLLFQNEGYISVIMSDYKLFPYCHGVYIENQYPPERAMLQSDFIEGTNLEEMLRASNAKGMDELTALPILCDMAHFVYACHVRGIIHRDVKLRNFMFDYHTNRTFGIDMGFSKLVAINDANKSIPSLVYKQHHFYLCGTPPYMAPEMFIGGPYTGSVDVWALGVCFYQLLYGTHPIHTKSEMFIDLKNREAQREAFDRCYQDTFYDDLFVSRDLNELIRRMLDPNQESRLTIEEVCNTLQLKVKIA
jgi:serine/threonine protein kinase